MSRRLIILRWPTLAYDEALAFQRRLVADYAGRPRDEGTLILLEHPPVITIGRSGSRRNILARDAELARAGVAVRETNRGGDVTYHGPGQVVGYPILPLAFHGRDVHAYLRRLERVLILALADFGIRAFRRDGLTGVWTEAGKIASIGVAIARWVAYHGFALNVAPNLAHFDLIHPCGLEGVRMTSMEKLLGSAPPREAVEQRLVRHFAAEFHFHEVVWQEGLSGLQEAVA